MTFSQAQFQEVVNKINRGMDDISNKMTQVPAAANDAMNQPSIPDFMKDAIKWCADKIVELATWIWNKIKEVMEGVAAPVTFFSYAFDWEDVRGIANGVAGQLKAQALPTTRTQVWTGPSATAYGKIIQPQGDAAAKIATISDKTATALQICAAAGLMFYVAIGVIIVKFIAAMVAAIAAFGSGAFSPAGLAIVVEEAGVNTAMITAAVSGLVAALGAQAQQMVGLHGEAIDNSTFPGGRWPDPTTGAFDKPA
jgi:hypothetical protein